MNACHLHVFVCAGPVCGDEGVALHRAARKLVGERSWGDAVEVHREVCLGYCHQGPNVMLCVQADPWGRAPLPGSEGSVSLHEMTESKLIDAVERRLAAAPSVGPRAQVPAPLAKR